MRAFKNGLAFIMIWACTIEIAGAQTASSVQPPASTPVETSPSANVGATASPSDTPQVSGDKFQGLRDLSAAARESYSKVHRQTMPEIDRLLKTRRCQIVRIGGLLDRTLEKLQEWSEAEVTYWTKWGEVEEVRVNEERKKLAIMETDQQRAKELIDTETQDREELLRKRATLEKYGKRSQDVVQQLDALVQEIRDSEARLAEATKKFEDLTIRVKNVDTLITTRLVQIRQAKADVEAVVLKQKSEYENLRTEAQDVCNTKKPVSGKSSFVSPGN